MWDSRRSAVETLGDNWSRWGAFGALGAVCLLAVVLRAYYVRNVFRGEDVLLIQVDPWKYRVHIERLTEQLRGPFDPAVVSDPGRAVGTGRGTGLSPTGQDDLMVATLTWIAELFGGTPRAVGTVLAAYPVVVAVLICVAVYLATTWLTEERWAGVVAAGVVAITPANVYRTALGFGDHHAFDYLWLALTLVLISYLLRKEELPRSRWVGAIAALGLVLAGQTLSWGGSPLLIAPYTGFALLLLVSTLRTDQSPAAVVGPFATSLFFAVELVVIPFYYLAWQTTTVVALLVVQTAILAVLVGLGEVSHRYVASPGLRVGGLLAVCVVAAGVVFQRVPEVTELLETGRSYFSRTTGTVAEATSLVGGEAPIGTVLSFFGPLFVLFLMGLVWSSWQVLKERDPGRLAVVTYAWYFLGLTVVQRRFAGELSVFFAVLVAISVVDLSRHYSRIRTATERAVAFLDTGSGDASSTTRGDLSALFTVTVLVVFVLSVTVAQVPLTMERRVVTDAEYDATQRIEAAAAERNGTGLTSNRNVFSPVNSRLMYNYYAHDGNIWFFEEKSRYAQFLVATDEEEWHRRLAGRGAGFVVVTNSHDVSTSSAIHTKLQDNLGSARGDVPGVARYGVIFRSSDDSTTVYTLVPGARLSGRAQGNQTVTVTTTVETPEQRVVYERTPQTTADGWYSVVVPYAGTYRAGDARIEVSQEMVDSGGTVGRAPTGAYWPLDERRGTVLFDHEGNNHAVGNGLQWTSGVTGSAVLFDGEGQATVAGESRLAASDGFTLSMWARTGSATGQSSANRARVVSTTPASGYQQTAGYQIGLDGGTVVGAVGDGTTATVLSGPRIDDGRWHQVVLTWDGETAGLYVDGCPRAADEFRSTPSLSDPLVFGASTDNTRRFVGALDEVRFRDDAVSATRIRSQFERVRDTTDVATNQSTTCRGSRSA